MTPFVEEYWKNLPKQRHIIDLYNTIPPNTEDDSYVDFVRKHALVDVMLGSFINDYFMEYEYFPFSGIGLLGWKAGATNLKSFWNYYYKEALDKLKTVKVSPIEEKMYEDELKHKDGQSRILQDIASSFNKNQ